jgi:hypothetical protein
VTQPSPHQHLPNTDAEAQLGGADAVEKTTYVVGRGTEPGERAEAGPAAQVRSRAPRAAALVIFVLMVLVALAYIAGIFAAR